MYFINGSKLSKQYCKESFSTHWIHFLPKDLMIYQGLLDLPAVVEIETNGISFIGLEQHIDSKLPILGYPLLDGRQSAPV